MGRRTEQRKACLLVALRAVDWYALLFVYVEPVPHNAILWSIGLSTLLTYLVLKTEPDRKSLLPAWLVAVSQVGVLLELFATPKLSSTSRYAIGTLARKLRMLWKDPPEAEGSAAASRTVEPAALLRAGGDVAAAAGDDCDRQQVTTELSELSLARQSSSCSSALPASSFTIGDATSEQRVRADQKMRLRLVRKMAMAQVPEAAVSTFVNLWTLVVFTHGLSWKEGLARDGFETTVDVGPKVFNEWFQESPNGIVMRDCPKCIRSHKVIYYKRVGLNRSEFEPYDYMKSNWTNWNNALHINFELYSNYRSAVAGKTADRWESCRFATRYSGVGFPGDCGPVRPAQDQWSSFECEYVWDYHCLSDLAVSFKIESIVRPFIDDFPLKTSAEVLAVIPRTMLTLIALMVAALGVADIVVWIWVQTGFVQAHSRYVASFYFFEMISWWLPMHLIYIEYSGKDLARYLVIDVLFMSGLVLVGFYRVPKRRRTRNFQSMVVHFLGQLLMSVSMAPVLVVGLNILFFDQCRTFRPLNSGYYLFRFLHNAIFVLHVPEWYASPPCVLAILSSTVLALFVYGIVPLKRRQWESGQAADFVMRTRHAAQSMLRSGGSAQETMALGKNARVSMQTNVMSLAAALTTGPASQFVHVMNAVGDTFEALLLASSADSPRVRSAVLGVAIQPLAEARRELLCCLLPLILPQLLLALRWRTVGDNDSERCPLSRFLLRQALTMEELPLVSLVYWQLVALATDHADKSRLKYRALRLSLLKALEARSFGSEDLNPRFTDKALQLLANQRRLYAQMRAVAMTAREVKGSSARKTAALRNLLISASPGNTSLLRLRPTSPHDMRKSRVRASGHSFAPSFAPSLPSFAPSPSFVPDADFPIARSAEDADATSRRWTIWGRGRKEKKADPWMEEWTNDVMLNSYEDATVNLSSGQSVPLPMDPSRGLKCVDPVRCFVAHSAVAPAVLSFQTVDLSESLAVSRRPSVEHGAVAAIRSSRAGTAESEVSRVESQDNGYRLYAVKVGDDLRQDALILQMFRLMESIWFEHGLDIILMPYSVLPVSPQEGVVAFVPQAVKVSDILKDYEGDVGRFLRHRCPDASAALDRLCGSAAGYCVASYLLGIGDRHLDNIMITEDGHFFHIDFGFVLGDDPKPCAPAVRVPREVIHAIISTGRLDRFRYLVGEAFVLLRRTARLWTALLTLMARAGGSGVSALQRDDQVGIQMVRSRLHLGLDDEEAKTEILLEIEEATVAVVPIMYDRLHQLSLFWH